MDNNNPSYFNPNVLNNISPFNYEPTIVEVDSIGIGISENTLSNLNLTPTQNLIVAEQSIYNLNTGNCNYTYGLQVDKTGIAINTSLDVRSSNYNYGLYVDGNIMVTGTIYSSNNYNYNFSNAGVIQVYSNYYYSISNFLPSNVSNVYNTNMYINNNGCFHTSNYTINSPIITYVPSQGFHVVNSNLGVNILTKSFGVSNIYEYHYFNTSNDITHNVISSNYNTSNLNIQNNDTSSNYNYSNVYIQKLDYDPLNQSFGYSNIYNYWSISNLDYNLSYINTSNYSNAYNFVSPNTSNYNFSNLSYLRIINNAYSNIYNEYNYGTFNEYTMVTSNYGKTSSNFDIYPNLTDSYNYTISNIYNIANSNLFTKSTSNNLATSNYDTYIYYSGQNMVFSNIVLTVSHSNDFSIPFIDIVDSSNIIKTDHYTYCNQHFFTINNQVYWNSNQNQTNGIYYAGNVTIGNAFASSCNGYALNVAESANRSVNNIQLSLQNTQSAGIRMGMIGTSNVSPAIINTPPGTRFEMHIGRDQNYFSNLYTSSNSGLVTPDEIPHYEYYPPSCNYYPSFQIDQYGNVAIHSSNIVNQPINYNTIYVTNSSNLSSNVSNPMAFEVDGPVFAHDIIMYDRYTGIPKHLDDIYSRVPYYNSINPSSINGGVFNNTYFRFPSLNVDTLIVNDSTFVNDIHGESDLVVRNVKFTGNLQTSIDSINWSNLSFTTQSPNSNVNYNGFGITTPGRFGTGINPIGNSIFYNDNSVDTQLAINKTESDIWDLKIIDVSQKGNYAFRKVAYIGHPPDYFVSSQFANDGSLVFATPLQNDQSFVTGNQIISQNFYFFPGANLNPTNGASQLLNSNCPPTLNIYANPFNTNTNYTPGRVGINTYTPKYEFDVNGSIRFTNNIYYNRGGTDLQMGIWTVAYDNYNSLIGIDTFNNVGINTIANSNYSLSILGNLSVDNIYTSHGKLLSYWYAGGSGGSGGSVYTYSNIGIGNTLPVYNVDIQSTGVGTGAGETTLRLLTSINQTTNAIRLSGVGNEWIIRTQHAYNRIEIGNNTSTDPSYERALWSQYNPIINRNQIVIGSNLNVFSDPNNPDHSALLTVGGNISVVGDVNIYGTYKMKGNILINANVVGPALSNLVGSSNDVFIAGDTITLNPNTKMLITNNNNNTTTDNSLLYINQSIQAATIATFASSAGDAYIKIVSAGGNTLTFGINNTTGNLGFLDTYNQYWISFYKTAFNNTNYVAFGNFANNSTPEAIVHIKSTANTNQMLKLTQVLPTFADNTGPNLIFEQYVENIGNTNSAYKTWMFEGPISQSNSGYYQEKLSLIYTSQIVCGTDLGVLVDSSSEIFSFTNDGCLGINNPKPVYSLDVINNQNEGALRILNYSSNPVPQIILQSRSNYNDTNNTYGNSINTDYAISVINDNLVITNKSYYTSNLTLISASSNGSIGLNSPPSPNYSVNLSSTLNVQSTPGNPANIYLDGISIFDRTSSNSTLSGPDILLLPEIDANYSGGVIVNYKNPTHNLFHLVSGSNANMLVLDSELSESQMNYTCYNSYSGGLKNIYRTGMSNNSFYWEFASNINLTTSKYINDSHSNFSPVAKFDLSLKSMTYGISNNFDMTIDGSLILSGCNASTNYSNIGIVEALNSNLVIVATNSKYINIGIGTTSPSSNIHLFSGSNGTVAIESSSSCNILSLVNNGSQKITVNSSGNLGIGTMIPRTQLDIIGSVYTNTGSANLPSYSFATSSNSGIYSPSNYVFAISTNGLERMRVNNNGYVGIGNSSPSCNLDVTGNVHISSNIYVDNYAYFNSNVTINKNLLVNGLFSNPSDSNIKKNIHRISDALDKVSRISGYTFDMISNNNKSTGLIAQEVRDVLPEVVSQDETGVYGIAYGNMMGLIVESIKELKTDIDAIKSKLEM